MECWAIIFGCICLVAAFCWQKYQSLSKNLPRPNFDPNEFWGKGEVSNYKEDSSIKPFKVAFGDEVKSVFVLVKQLS